MKYILVLGIKYKKYKKPAVINLHIGDRFIDTFRLEHDYPGVENVDRHVEQFWFDKLGKSKWIENIYDPTCGLYYDPTLKTYKFDKLPNFFKVYTIDEETLEGKIKIEVNNSNNDSNNGFMKNNSLINLSIVGLFPSALTDNMGEKFVKTITRLEETACKYPFDVYNVVEHGSWIGNKWPLAESFYVRHKKNKDRTANSWDWLGVDFTAEFTIRKKHKVKYIGSVHQHKEIGCFETYNRETVTLASCKPLLNIYNEDQRSNNTKD
jgi:hypothetical protein